jgi:hypothetical protein
MTPLFHLSESAHKSETTIMTHQILLMDPFYLHPKVTESTQIAFLGNTKVMLVNNFGQVTSNCNRLHLESNLPNPVTASLIYSYNHMNTKAHINAQHPARHTQTHTQLVVWCSNSSKPYKPGLRSSPKPAL